MNDQVVQALAAAIIDPLTTPDSEDWVVLCDRDTIHDTAIREFGEGAKRRVEARHGCAPLREFKSLVRSLPHGHDLGLVQVIVPTDGKLTGGIKLLAWLSAKAREKKFNVTSMHGMVPTREAVAALAERVEHWTKS